MLVFVGLNAGQKWGSRKGYVTFIGLDGERVVDNFTVVHLMFIYLFHTPTNITWSPHSVATINMRPSVAETGDVMGATTSKVMPCGALVCCF